MTMRAEEENISETDRRQRREGVEGHAPRRGCGERDVAAISSAEVSTSARREATPEEVERYLCCHCGKERNDAPTGGETDFGWVDGKHVPVTYWTYCRPCDFWTEHPIIDDYNGEID